MFFVKGRTKNVEPLNEKAFLGTFLLSKAVTDSHLKKKKDETPKTFPSPVVLGVNGKDFKASYEVIAIWKGFCFSEIAWQQSAPWHQQFQMINLDKSYINRYKSIEDDRYSVYRLNYNILVVSDFMKRVFI